MSYIELQNYTKKMNHHTWLKLGPKKWVNGNEKIIDCKRIIDIN